MKLRALMDFIAIEVPTVRVALPREAPELLNAFFEPSLPVRVAGNR
jgi:hypothetical protein